MIASGPEPIKTKRLFVHRQRPTGRPQLRRTGSWHGLVACLLLWLVSTSAMAQLRISEFMASNTKTLKDEDGSFEDWIEIQNPTSTNIDLAGWYLTDSASQFDKWSFPSTNLASGRFLVVFASGKNRRVPGQPLHTNFKLDAAGDYLALVLPDGTHVASEFKPTFPPQFPDVSYGLSMQANRLTLVATNAPVRFLVPTDASVDATWMQLNFTDSAWTAGTNGLGYETGLTDPLENSYAGRVLQDNPVLYWRLDETNGTTAHNLGSLGATADGQYQGGITLGGAGPRAPEYSGFEPDNRAPQFNGVDASIGGPKGLLNNVSQFTMAGWIRPTATLGNRTGLFGQNDAIEFGFINGSTIQLWTPVNSINAPYPFPTNQWHHAAAVGDATQLALYFDGALSASSPATVSSYPASGFNFNAGGGGVFDATGNPFRGQIDEVAVWTRALNADEIRGLVSGSSAGQVSYATNINTDVRTLMDGSNASVYVRIPFSAADPSSLEQLTLRVRYDDGFVVFLNGSEVARKNAPDTLAWNSTATARHPDTLAVQFEEFDVTSARGFLMPGANLLAIQGLNIAPTNTDFLLQVELDAASAGLTGSEYRYFLTPTPGAANGSGTADLGPIFLNVGHAPALPLVTDPVVVTARVAQAFNTVSNVTLTYRVMFGPETQLPMNDSGANGDAVAGDGVWTAVIPAGAATPGQMVRYALTAADTQNHLSRWPLFSNPTDSEQYWGTMVAGTNLQSRLPVVHLFAQNTSALDSGAVVRGSLFFLGELYDNVRFRVHGQSSSGWPKKGYNIDFNRDHRFLYAPGAPRQKQITLMSPYGDKTRMHTSLVYAEVAEAGGDGHFSFQVRVQRNTGFYGIESMIENADDLWLARLGRDPDGALYKMYNDMSSAGGNEKKTRISEDFSDLQTLINNLDESRPLANRVRYAFDNLDLPQTVSYFATMALVSSQDHGHKNYYLCRDSIGTGEWTIFPWDVDLSWGRNWVDRLGYFSDILYQTNTLSFYDPVQQSKPANRLYDLVFDHADFRRMYLRRLRSLMDAILMPPGAPASSLPIEAHIRQYKDLMAPPGATNTDADLDRAQWGPNWGNAAYDDLRVEAERTISVHLPGRREFLFNSPLATLRGERIPPAQPANAVVTIAALDFKPASGNQDEEFIQVLNTNTFAADISGWTLGGAIDFIFKPGTVIPAGASVYVSPNVNAFRARAASPRGGQSLFIQGNYHGHLSAWGGTIDLADNTGRLVFTSSYAGDPSPAQRFLRITEIMYNPAPSAGDATDAQEFEFLELKNISTDLTLDLTGVALTHGVEFTFTGSAVTHLAPGKPVLVVRNTAAFLSRYGPGPFPIAGQYTGALDNAGERIRLQDAVGETILDFAYDNRWYPITDGLGFSLVIVDDMAPWDTWSQKESWRASGRPDGSPGTTDPAPSVVPPVLVNEALAHPQAPGLDAIELFNPSTNAVDLAGWFLTDSFHNPRKYRIPTGVTLNAGAYRLFTADEFGQGTNGFRLSALGDQTYLFSGDTTTNLTGYYHGYSFGASPEGVSVGRYVNSLGQEQFVLQSANSLGTNNAYPRVGPVVISEIMLHPPDLGGTNNLLGQFLELQNVSATNTPLYDPAHASNTWQLRQAVTYDFPASVSLAPAHRLLLVSFDPANSVQLAAFRAAYAVPADVPVFGPWSGRLDDAGEAIELQQPGPPQDAETKTIVPYYLVERIDYANRAPWPTNADGSGFSLQRIEAALFGNDPNNWQAAPPTAGQPNPPGLSPDTDGDGMPDVWELANGTNPMVNDAAADPDRDGLTNLQEYWAGTSPTNAASVLRIDAVQRLSTTEIALQFPIPSHRAYQVEYRNDLAQPGWSILTALPAVATNRIVALPVPLDPTGSRYYRLTVPAAPAP